MCKSLWIALAIAALMTGSGSARAQEPAGPALSETAPPEPAANPPAAAVPVAPAEGDAGPTLPAVELPSRNAQRCPACGGPMNGSDRGGCCAECGKRQKKVARFLDWLIYIPEDLGKTKCCKGCDSCPPPAWAFFPCEGGGRCNTCVASAATVFYAKAPGAATTSRVVQSAYPQPKAAPKPAEQPPRISSYNPQNVSGKMPVLDPTQFRKPGADGN